MSFTENLKKLPRSSWLLFFLGLFFGLAQSSLFFMVQMYITASFLGYFAVLSAWLVGLMVSMRIRFTASLLWVWLPGWLLQLSLYTWAQKETDSPFLLPLVMGLAALQSFCLGSYLKQISQSGLAAAQLLFHENNGFVLGLILGLPLFLSLGPIYFLVLLPFLALLAALPLSRLQTSPQPSPSLHTPHLTLILLFLCGLNGIFLQYLLVREFSMILSATELSVLAVGAIHLAGYSLGYRLAPSLSMTWVRILAALSFLGHLLLLCFGPLIVHYCLSLGLHWMGALGLVLAMVSLSSLAYSVFLPALIQSHGASTFSKSYAADIAGAATAGGLLFFFFNILSNHLPALYFTIFLILLCLIWRKHRGQHTVLAFAFGLWTLFMVGGTGLFQAVRTDAYRFRGYSNPQLVSSKNSFYHALDVVDSYAGPDKTNLQKRTSFMNGVRYFEAKFNRRGRLLADSSSLGEFTYFLAELPAKLLSETQAKPLRILILGGGSLSTFYRVSPYASKVTLVELDPLMVQSSKQYWKSLNRWDQVTNGEILIGDARQYLRNTSEKFDLIINDISAPYYLGAMLMHSRELYQLAKSRLNFGGVFSESTQARPDPEQPNRPAMRILKGVTEIFPHTFLLEGTGSPRGERGHVYASDKLLPEMSIWQEVLRNDEKLEKTELHSHPMAVFPLLDRSRSYALGDMTSLISNNLRRIKKYLTRSEAQIRRYSSWKFVGYETSRYLKNQIKSVGGLFLGMIGLIFFIAGLEFMGRQKPGTSAGSSYPE